jgi:predicted RNA-binding protein with PIN domain
MSAESVLLEPYYEFRLQIPQELLGRAMMDLERMEARFRISENRDGRAELTGLGPVRLMRNYQGELIAYSKGQGKLQCAYAGHFPSRDQKELVEAMAYCPEEDLLNPSGSVFCQHGAGYFVPWDEVTEHMHMPFAVPEFAGRGNRQTAEEAVPGRNETEEHFIGTEEIDAILERAAGSNRRKDPLRKRRKYKETIKRVPKAEKKAGFPEKRLEYLLVDGYNIIHAWEELKELIPRGMDAARGRLMDLLCNYQAAKGCELIVVFDAYRLKGHETEIMDYHNIHVVYTKEAETADQYIEKFAHSNGAKYNITVATSDGMEQLIIRGEGCMLLSAREFLEELHRTDEANKEAFYEKNKEELFQANHVMKPLLCGVQIEENKE